MGWFRSRGALPLLLGAYVALMIVVVWTPVSLTEPIRPALRAMDAGLHRALGTSPGLAPLVLDFVANVVFFVPPSLLLALRVRREHWTIVVLVGFACAVLIEMVQLQFLPGRAADINDVIANTLGAVVGVWAARLVRRHRGPPGARDGSGPPRP